MITTIVAVVLLAAAFAAQQIWGAFRKAQRRARVQSTRERHTEIWEQKMRERQATRID